MRYESMLAVAALSGSSFSRMGRAFGALEDLTEQIEKSRKPIPYVAPLLYRRVKRRLYLGLLVLTIVDNRNRGPPCI